MSSDSTRKTYPAGRVAPASVRTWTFYVEADAPHRVIKWTRTDGISAELVGSKRLPYWSLNSEGHEQHLKDIGLKPRPPLSP